MRSIYQKACPQNFIFFAPIKRHFTQNALVKITMRLIIRCARVFKLEGGADMEMFVCIVLCLTVHFVSVLVMWIISTLWGGKSVNIGEDFIKLIQLLLEFFLFLLWILLYT